MPVQPTSPTTPSGGTDLDEYGMTTDQRAEFDQALESMAASTMQSSNSAMKAAMEKLQEEPEPDEDDDEPL